MFSTGQHLYSADDPLLPLRDHHPDPALHAQVGPYCFVVNQHQVCGKIMRADSFLWQVQSLNLATLFWLAAFAFMRDKNKIILVIMSTFLFHCIIRKD
jgi:hypothetical protein